MEGLIWSVLLATIGIIGIWLAGRKNLWGWAVGFGAQFLWAIYGVISGQWGFLLSAVAYGVVYAKNFVAWYESERRERDGFGGRQPIVETIDDVVELLDGRVSTPRHWNGQPSS